MNYHRLGQILNIERLRCTHTKYLHEKPWQFTRNARSRPIFTLVSVPLHNYADSPMTLMDIDFEPLFNLLRSEYVVIIFLYFVQYEQGVLDFTNAQIARLRGYDHTKLKKKTTKFQVNNNTSVSTLICMHSNYIVELLHDRSMWQSVYDQPHDHYRTSVKWKYWQ